MESHLIFSVARPSVFEDTNLYEFEGVNYTVQPSRQLYLRNIDPSVTEEVLRSGTRPLRPIQWLLVASASGPRFSSPTHPLSWLYCDRQKKKIQTR